MTKAKTKKLIAELCAWLRERGLSQQQVETLPRCIILGFVEGMFIVGVIHRKGDHLRLGIVKGRPEGVAGHVDYIKFAKQKKI